MKKIVSITLVCAIVLTTSMTAFAAGRKYDEMTKPLGYSYSRATVNDILDLDEIYPSDEVKIELPLLSEMFQVESGDTQPPAGTKLSTADIRSSKIAVRTQSSGGSKVVKDYKIDTRNSTVKVEFVDEWVSTKEQDFEIFVYLTINGRRQSDYGITLIGTLKNYEIPVYADFDHVDLSMGYVADAQDFVSNIEVDLGNGVSIYTKMFKGKKYYGTASRQIDESADIVMRQYPDIDNVITLKTVGLNSTGDIVRLDTDYSGYYVYDRELRYIGQSNEMLPFSAVYYLANKALDIEDDEEPDDSDDEPEDESGNNPGTGGNGNSSNANANPGTGC